MNNRNTSDHINSRMVQAIPNLSTWCPNAHSSMDEDLSKHALTSHNTVIIIPNWVQIRRMLHTCGL